jgi:MtfA peptidase
VGAHTWQRSAAERPAHAAASAHDVLGFLRKRRRLRLRRAPLTDDERELVARNVPYYRGLDEARRRQLDGLVRIFLDEKRFEGCGGLEVTHEMRLTIAAQACLLLLGRDSDVYPLLQSVLVYPGAYRSREPVLEPDGTVAEDAEERIGESWTRGSVVLSWDDVSRAGGAADGVNVVLHELAHQLDEENGEANGTPRLPAPSMYAEWARVLGGEYEALAAAVERGEATLIDEYGVESPAEFFAVATECFFERAAEMKARHPELYTQLAACYGQDSASVALPLPRLRRRIRRHPRRRA